MGKREKDPNRLGFKAYFGTTIMASSEGITAALMTAWFRVYLTDYAGLGTWGAVLGSSLLLFVRIFDAVNDPIEGWIIDRAKVGKLGKYKPFIILSICLITIGVCCLFSIPGTIVNSPFFVALWVVFFYLMYDIGYSFFAPNLVYRTLTLDSIQRGKLMIGPRLMGLITGMISSSVITIATGINKSINNMHTSFGITALALVGGFALLSLLGIALVKEKFHAPVDEDSKRIKLTDFFLLMKENKALRTNILSNVFGGFLWTFLFATLLYYIKWGFCTDLTTGVVDQAAYGTMSLVGSMLMFVPLILGTIIATPLMKLMKSPVRTYRLLLLVEAIPCGLLFILQILGLLQGQPTLFFLCAGLTALGIGANFIPIETINIECMDYEIYQHGKDRSALCNAFNLFVKKAQSAVATAAVGALLVAVGYVVDSSTDTYLGELSAMPTLLNWFVVIMGAIPFVLGLVAWFIMRAYPVTNEERADMKIKLHGAK